jgi:formylglycine-generating enzyme required for sulfatase activity
LEAEAIKAAAPVEQACCSVVLLQAGAAARICVHFLLMLQGYQMKMEHASAGAGFSNRCTSPSPPPFASAWGDDEYGLWADLEVPCAQEGVAQKLRWIPPGSFLMGSLDSEVGRGDDEGPQHNVDITRGFWLFDTACTQALWRAVTGDNPSRFQRPDRPVERVSWDDVQEFLKRIDVLVSPLGLRLPSEAQWEYACRAGTTTPFSFGETITAEEVNYDSNFPYRSGKKGLYRQETVAVGSLPANRWGLYEMHGNVWEWCADHWHSSYIGAPAGGGAWIDSEVVAGGSRVMRGGSWLGQARFARSAFRLRMHQDARNFHLGFRCALVQEP